MLIIYAAAAANRKSCLPQGQTVLENALKQIPTLGFVGREIKLMEQRPCKCQESLQDILVLPNPCGCLI